MLLLSGCGGSSTPLSGPASFEGQVVDMTHLCSGYLDVYLGGTLAAGFEPAVSTAQLEVALDLVAVE